jgi:hypothetical protein
MPAIGAAAASTINGLYFPALACGLQSYPLRRFLSLSWPLRTLATDPHMLSLRRAAHQNQARAVVKSAEEQEAVRVKLSGFFFSSRLPLTADEERKHRAAVAIQTAAIKRIVGNGVKLKREAVIDRLKLESTLGRDLRLMLLCAIQFVLVIALCLAESNAHARLGLLRTYKDIFFLDDALAGIKTLHSLQNYLRTVSERGCMLQPVSDYYFRQQEGEIRVFEGLHAFTKPVILNVQDLNPRFDTPEWTLTAWVQHEAEGDSSFSCARVGVVSVNPERKREVHERDRVAQRKSARERESETFLSKTVLRTLWTLHATHA